MGVVAALATQSNKIGVIGGGEGSEITRGHEGYKAGARSINPDIEIQEVYTGDWNDTTGAYEAAIGMYDSGVDVIWHSGDGIGLGVVQAAEEKDKYVLGNVENQFSLAEKNVLSGLQYEWGNALENIFAMIKDKSFFVEGKDTVMINVANGGLSMTELNDVKGWLTDEDKAIIADVYEKLGQGAIELPEV
jgi:basic membrane protein A